MTTDVYYSNDTLIFRHLSVLFVEGGREMYGRADEIRLAPASSSPQCKSDSFPRMGSASEKMNAVSYDNFYFIDDGKKRELLNEDVSEVRVLAERTGGRSLESFHSFTESFDAVRDYLFRRNTRVVSVNKFTYIATRDFREDDPSPVIPADAPSLFDSQFRVAEVHSSDCHATSFYPLHRDKVGNLVAFLGVSGFSFTFMAFPRETSSGKKTNVNVNVNAIEVTEGTKVGTDNWSSYWDYKKFCKGLSSKEKKRVRNFERVLKQSNLCSRVYRLEPGDLLVFPAHYYLHGIIVPKQIETRTLAVFYKLIPISNIKKKVKLAKKTGTSGPAPPPVSENRQTREEWARSRVVQVLGPRYDRSTHADFLRLLSNPNRQWRTELQKTTELRLRWQCPCPEECRNSCPPQVSLKRFLCHLTDKSRKCAYHAMVLSYLGHVGTTRLRAR